MRYKFLSGGRYLAMVFALTLTTASLAKESIPGVDSRYRRRYCYGRRDFADHCGAIRRRRDAATSTAVHTMGVLRIDRVPRGI